MSSSSSRFRPTQRSARMTGPLDRMESAGVAFHEAVAEGFRALAATDGERWLVVDGAGPVDDVTRRVDLAFDAWAGARR